MYKALTMAMALVIGFFTLIFGMLLVIPLAILGVITGKRLRDNINAQAAFNQSPLNQAQRQEQGVIEGEFEEVKR